MSNQTDTNEGNVTNQPIDTPAATGMPPPPEQYNPYNATYAPAPPVAASSEPAFESPPPPASSVVVSEGGGGGIPRWFYIILAVTLIAFFVVTGLLVTTILKSKLTSSPAQPTVVPTSSQIKDSPSPTMVIPTALPTPTPDQVVINLQQASTSDELVEIEKDLNNTDLSPVMNSLKEFDAEMKITSK